MKPVFPFFLLLIVLFEGCSIINPFRKSPFNVYTTNIKNQPFDAIIVPGVPFNGESWNKIMRSRVYWSKFLFEKGYTKNIIYSGGAVYTPFTESKIMALYAEELGIPKENIYTEEKAEHSTENVYYSYYLAKSLGFKNIALASDPYQTNNLRQYIRKYKLPYKVLPILYDTIYIMNIDEPKITGDSAKVDLDNFVELPERESFFKRLKGTLGKNINYTEEDEERRKGLDPK